MTCDSRLELGQDIVDGGDKETVPASSLRCAGSKEGSNALWALGTWA